MSGKRVLRAAVVLLFAALLPIWPTARVAAFAASSMGESRGGGLTTAAQAPPGAPSGGVWGVPKNRGGAGPPAQVGAGATLAILAGDVQVSIGGGPFRPAEDGMTLAAGDRVRSGPESHALLTYFDGSTTLLEPETEVAIRRVEADAGQQTFFVSLALTGGTLWNRVSQLLGFGAQFEVGGQTATAVVRGTLLGVKLSRDQGLLAWTTEGAFEVHAAGKVVHLQAGQKAVAPPDRDPALVPSEPHANWLEVDATPGVYVRAVDPRGRAVGYVTPGMPVNQVVDGWTSGGLGKPERFRFPNPLAGRYLLVVEGDAPGPYTVTITGRHRERVVFQHQLEADIAVGGRHAIALDIALADGNLVGATASGPQPLGAPGPGKALVTPNEWRRAVPRAFWPQTDPRAVPPQCGAGGLYVAEARHWICPPFLPWLEERQLLGWLGAPRSEAFVERGVLVQYFAHGRLEHHPWLPETWQVQLGLLGDELGRAQPGAAAGPVADPRVRYVPETGQLVGPPFRAAWEALGLDLLGYPIAPAATAGGQTYQDFQRARLVATPGGVTRLPLGDEYLRARGWLR